IPMLSQIHVVCDEPGPPDGPVETEPLTTIGRLPEYTAWWVIALDRFVYGQEDRAFGRAMLPVMRRAMDYYRTNLSNGVFVTQNTAGVP
ncbi:hypothetical protein NL529_29420, partial [Klebsiella pneumoniae]|nr:hypothetical protein [Klebsiella pneumoniae]